MPTLNTIVSVAWKDKILDYEIETISNTFVTIYSQPWKDKILDYEIETSLSPVPVRRLPTWKDKILDYEIETAHRVSADPTLENQLEKIRFSITRLKQPLADNESAGVSWKSWKDKILDYEIETRCKEYRPCDSHYRPWKDKILDYEIETKILDHAAMLWKRFILKR